MGEGKNGFPICINTMNNVRNGRPEYISPPIPDNPVKLAYPGRLWEWRIDRAMHSMAATVYPPKTEMRRHRVTDTLSIGALTFVGGALFGKISYSLW